MMPLSNDLATSSFVLFEGTTASTSIFEEHSYDIFDPTTITSATFTLLTLSTTEPVTSTFVVFSPSSIETGVGSDVTTALLPVSVPTDPVFNGTSRQGQGMFSRIPTNVTPKEMFAAQLTTKTVVETNSNSAPSSPSSSSTAQRQSSLRAVRWIGSVVICVLVMGLFT
ncbi:hypothetical protein Moror_12991 [Moniliophthora roreri MCA 2997]|uniref:Uncharacterized protein n=1 Tax=Moniliophthora roreri (strain MCA 2997) TaxID=1381753 RepID=V2YQD3_MONRO|nr:hypothetical protein Moror_12991 [Moniliophthora roreri MCA 2997]